MNRENFECVVLVAVIRKRCQGIMGGSAVAEGGGFRLSVVVIDGIRLKSHDRVLGLAKNRRRKSPAG